MKKLNLKKASSKRKKQCKFIIRKTGKRCKHKVKYPLGKPAYCTAHYVEKLEINKIDRRFKRK